MLTMERRVYLILVLSLALLLAACGGSSPTGTADAQDSASTAEEQASDGWLPDAPPVYPHAQALRDRMDPLLMDTFGITSVHYNSLDAMQTYDVRYALQDVPDGEAFYYALEGVYEAASDFYLFGEHESAESYFEWNDDAPEDMSIAIELDGTNYYWVVIFDGNYLTFTQI